MASLSERRRVARSYHRDADDAQPIKRAINQWIANAAAEARLRRAAGSDCAAGRTLGLSGGGQTTMPVLPADWALLLETRHLLTVRALRGTASGIDEATIVVPNPDAAECRAIVEAAPSVVALPLSTHALFAALTRPHSPERVELERKGWPGQFAVVWLDYCGTFNGAARAGRQRQQDLEQLFAQHLLAVPLAVLAITFTTRGATELYHGELVEHLVLLTEGYASCHGQHARLLGVASYHPNIVLGRAPKGNPSMHTAMFTVCPETRNGGSCSRQGNEQPQPTASPVVDGGEDSVRLQYVSGDELRARVYERGRDWSGLRAKSGDADGKPSQLWSAIKWAAVVFAASLCSSYNSCSSTASEKRVESDPQAGPETSTGPMFCDTVVVVESTPLLLVSNLIADAITLPAAVEVRPVIRASRQVSTTNNQCGTQSRQQLKSSKLSPEMVVAAARLGMEREHAAPTVKKHAVETAETNDATAMNLRSRVLPACPTVAAALDPELQHQSLSSGTGTIRVCGAWLGYEGLHASGGGVGKPWRLEQLRRGEGPQPLWSDLKCLLTAANRNLQAANRMQQQTLTRPEDSQSARRQNALAVVVSLRYASTAEVWQGAAVDNLLHGMGIAVAANDWQIGSVGWVVTYAVTSPRLACLLYLVPNETVEIDSLSKEAAPAAALCVRPIAEAPPAACGELSRCCALDKECFGNQEGQTTPIDELRLMHNPERGQYIDVVEICTRAAATGTADDEVTSSGVATRDIVGFVAYECRGDDAHILIVAVTSTARRCGVGTLLVDAVLSRARALLLWRCRLEVREENLAARALYTQLGFVQVGSCQTKYYSDGGNALKLSCPLLPDTLQRPRTSLWWYRLEMLPQVMRESGADLSDAEASLEVSARWRHLKCSGSNATAPWDGKAAADRARFETEAKAAAEKLRVAQAIDTQQQRLKRCKLKGIGSNEAQDKVSHLCDHLPAPPVKQWQASWVGGTSGDGSARATACIQECRVAWDSARPKIPTSSARKYQTIAQTLILPSAKTILTALETSAEVGDEERGGSNSLLKITLLLHEPGFHHCLPALQGWIRRPRGNQAAPAGQVDGFCLFEDNRVSINLLCCAPGDAVQEAELQRRELPVVMSGSDQRLTTLQQRQACVSLLPSVAAPEPGDRNVAVSSNVCAADCSIGNVRAAARDTIDGAGALVLVLLWEGGAVSWDETFGEWIQQVLTGARAQTAGATTDTGTATSTSTAPREECQKQQQQQQHDDEKKDLQSSAGVMLWLSCESSAEPEETLTLLHRLLLVDRGLDTLGWRWQQHSLSSITSESRRYIVAGLQLIDMSPVAG